MKKRIVAAALAAVLVCGINSLGVESAHTYYTKLMSVCQYCSPKRQQEKSNYAFYLPKVYNKYCETDSFCKYIIRERKI